MPLWNWAAKDQPYYGFGEPNSIMVVYTEPLGKGTILRMDKLCNMGTTEYSTNKTEDMTTTMAPGTLALVQQQPCFIGLCHVIGVGVYGLCASKQGRRFRREIVLHDVTAWSLCFSICI